MTILSFDRLSRRLLVFFGLWLKICKCIFEMFSLVGHFLHPPRTSPFRRLDALSWARKGAMHRSCRKASCGVLASPINRNKLKKKEKGGGKASYLFLRAREEDRGSAIVNGERGGRGCITSLHHVRGKWGWETRGGSIMEADFAGQRVITRNFGKTKSILGKKFVSASFEGHNYCVQRELWSFRKYTASQRKFTHTVKKIV